MRAMDRFWIAANACRRKSTCLAIPPFNRKIHDIAPAMLTFCPVGIRLSASVKARCHAFISEGGLVVVRISAQYYALVMKNIIQKVRHAKGKNRIYRKKP
jgi:hypothetical protein